VQAPSVPAGIIINTGLTSPSCSQHHTVALCRSNSSRIESSPHVRLGAHTSSNSPSFSQIFPSSSLKQPINSSNIRTKHGQQHTHFFASHRHHSTQKQTPSPSVASFSGGRSRHIKAHCQPNWVLHAPRADVLQYVAAVGAASGRPREQAPAPTRRGCAPHAGRPLALCTGLPVTVSRSRHLTGPPGTMACGTLGASQKIAEAQA